MQKYILTQDIGLFSCKAALFSVNGTLIKSNVVHYSPQNSSEGWAWQSPDLWWSAFCQNCRILLANIPSKSVVGVSMCGQMMGCLPVDKDLHPICDSITWDDRRSSRQVMQIERQLGNETIHKITGTCIGDSFSLPKVLWIKQNRPDIYEKAYKFITCKDYVCYMLTGILCTDETCAGFTQMYDLYSECWSKSILTAFDIDEEKLPDVLRAGSIIGTLTERAASQTGLSVNTPVVQGVGDGRAPAVGCGLRSPGDAYINLGSCSWISQCTDSREFDSMHSITKASYLSSGLYVNGGTTLAGRLCLNWFCNTFLKQGNMESDSLDLFLQEQLENSPVGSRGLLFMPYLRGERAPWWSSSAGGGFIGLNSRHTRYDLCRSILEGVSFQLAQIKNQISTIQPFSSMCLVGSAASQAWQQILSDVLEVEITAFDHSSLIGCIGSAVICGVALGELNNYSDVYYFRQNPTITLPIEKNVKMYQEIFPAFEDCYYALADISKHLGQL